MTAPSPTDAPAATRATTPPRRDTHRLRRAASVAGGAVLVVVIVAGLVTLVGTLVGVGSTSAPRPAAAADTAAPVSWPPPPAGVVPTSVDIPSLAVSSSLMPLGRTPTGEVAVPPLARPMQAAWYDESPVPSAPGAAVILGHVNGDGKPGVFNHLRLVRPGAQVLVRRSDGQTAVFTVSRVQVLPKDAFPGELLYGTDGAPELRVVTCGGTLDARTHSYESNVVAFAGLTAVRPS